MKPKGIRNHRMKTYVVTKMVKPISICTKAASLLNLRRARMMETLTRKVQVAVLPYWWMRMSNSFGPSVIIYMIKILFRTEKS